MKDSNGKNLKHGDIIETERGARLLVVKKMMTIFLKNSSNGQIIHFFKVS